MKNAYRIIKRFYSQILICSFIFIASTYTTDQAFSQQRANACPYMPKAECKVCTSTSSVCSWRNCCKQHSASLKSKSQTTNITAVAGPMCVTKCNRGNETDADREACYETCSKAVEFKPVIAELNKDGLNKPAESSDKPKEMILVAPEVHQKSGSGIPAVGGGKVSSGDKNVVRYSCCDNVIIRKGSSDKTDNIGKLSEGEQVWVQDLLPSTGLQTAFKEAEDCYKTGKNCKNAISKLSDISKINYYAKIFAVEQGKTGYVPLTSLFVRPVNQTKNRVVLQTGYEVIAKLLHNNIKKVTHPEGCAASGTGKTVNGGNKDWWWNEAIGEAVSCDERLACEEEWAQEEVDGQVRKWIVKPCKFKGNCNDCRNWYAQGKPDAYEECVKNLPEGFSPKDHCSGASFNNPYCDPYIGKGESKTFKDPKDYKCGEYPIGTTHYNDKSNFDNKMLMSFWFWDRRHDFLMNRVSGQNAPSFSTYDLSSKSVVNQSSGKELGSKNIWMSLNPGQNFIDIYLCTYLPGVNFIGPTVDYDPKDTYKWLITKIEWPDVSVDQVKVCAKTKLSVDKNLTPTMKWDVTNLELVNLNVKDVEVVKSGYFYAAAVATAGIVPLVGPLGHFIIGVAQTGVILEMIAEESIESFINHNNDEDYMMYLMPDEFKKELLKNLSDALNKETGKALASVPDAKGRIETACDALLPSVPSNSPLYYFYKYIQNQCSLLTSEYSFYPFVANAGARGESCYGTNKFFTPYDYNKGAWWTIVTGQEWYFPIMKDKGCRLDTIVENSMLDSAVWPVLRCATFVANAKLNGLLKTSLVQGMTDTCSEVGLNSMLDLYGDGKDLYEQYMSKHGGDGGPGTKIKFK